MSSISDFLLLLIPSDDGTLPGNRLITSDGNNFMTSNSEYFIVQEA